MTPPRSPGGAGQVPGQVRKTQRQCPEIKDEEVRLTEWIIKLATQYGRYGYRRTTAMLRREDREVDHKRVERIWRKERLKVRQKQPKRKRHVSPRAVVYRFTGPAVVDDVRWSQETIDRISQL